MLPGLLARLYQPGRTRPSLSLLRVFRVSQLDLSTICIRMRVFAAAKQAVGRKQSLSGAETRRTLGIFEVIEIDRFQ